MAFAQRFGGQNIFPSQLTYQLIELTEDIELQWAMEVAAPGVLVVSDIIDVDADAIDWEIAFPDARNAGPGQSVLINNVGSNQVIITDALGNEIGAVPDGEVWQFYLSDNTTEAGTWETFQFGTGTSSAVAAALAGAGLKAIANTLNVQLTPRGSAVSPLTIDNSDRAKIVQWTGGVGTGTLPDPAVVGSDWFVLVRNNGTGTWTITPTAGDIDGAANLELSPTGSTIIYTDGTNYFTIGLSTYATSNFDFIAINVAGSGDLVLAGAQLDRISYRLTGVLTGNRNIIVPSAIQQYWINNSTAGNFTLTVKTAAGLGILVPQGSAIIVYSDGTDVVASDGAPLTGLLPVGRGGTGQAVYSIGDILYASSALVLSRLPYVATASRYLGQNAGVPGWVQVDLSNGTTGTLPPGSLPSGSALSVWGRSANSAGVQASIVGTAGQVLRVADDGSVLAFGQINASTAITGILPVVNGGTGLATATQGDLLYGSAANTYSPLAKSTDLYAVLTNQGATNNPAWQRPRFHATAPANSDITFALSDAWGWIPHTGGSPQNWTIPLNGTIPFAFGTMIGIDNRFGAGNISIVPTGGVTLDGHGSTGTIVIAPGYKAFIVKTNTDVWMCMTDSPVLAGIGVTFAGWVDAAAASSKFNPQAAGWAASNPGTGVTRITHNLGLAAAEDLAVSPAYVSGADDRSISISALNVNYFEYTVNDIGSGPVNVPTFFQATRLV